jgi:Uma2 family endonuclease
VVVHPRPDVEFIPDVMVYPDTGETARFTGTPMLCVEILSSNRATDLVVKTTRCAALGVDHYWVIDATTLTAFVRDGALYLADRIVTDTAEELHFGIGSIRIDLAALTR